MKLILRLKILVLGFQLICIEIRILLLYVPNTYILFIYMLCLSKQYLLYV